jgi:hypothetical protein
MGGDPLAASPPLHSKRQRKPGVKTPPSGSSVQLKCKCADCSTVEQYMALPDALHNLGPHWCLGLTTIG